jgi:hypothetical protein
MDVSAALQHGIEVHPALLRNDMVCLGVTRGGAGIPGADVETAGLEHDDHAFPPTSSDSA